MSFSNMPLFAALFVILAVTSYAAWEMFRVARFWQDAENFFLRTLALFFKVFAVAMCVFVFAVCLFWFFAGGSVAIY